MLRTQQSGETMAASCGGLEHTGTKFMTRNASDFFNLDRALSSDSPGAVLKTASGRLGDTDQFAQFDTRKTLSLPILPQKFMRSGHSDTYGIDSKPIVSIPIVSDCSLGLNYHSRMANKKKTPPAWGGRLTDHLRENGLSVANLAKKMVNQKTGLERTPAALRHWMNGHRQVNVQEFIELCLHAGADPAYILFGRPLMIEDVDSKVGDLLNALKSYEKLAPSTALRVTEKAPRANRPKSTARAATQLGKRGHAKVPATKAQKS